ncbi:uncharacterized protein [Penaeus vannamei]|uniref:uncharacterized protein n=1 Tax=Penaeus vannamei TaxID=6689 RepID=UPI00387F4951
MLMENIISAVYERKALWDPAHPLHKNAVVLKNLWGEIGQALNTPEKIARNKWKNARDYYRRELKRKEVRGQNEEPVSSTWPYFQQMAFLRDVIMADMDNCDKQFSTLPWPRTLQRSPRHAGKDRKEGTPGKRKREEEEQEAAEDDMHFFKSLMPHMKDMPSTKKLRLRAQILDLFLLQEDDELEN